MARCEKPPKAGLRSIRTFYFSAKQQHIGVLEALVWRNLPTLALAYLILVEWTTFDLCGLNSSVEVFWNERLNAKCHEMRIPALCSAEELKDCCS